jgi:hypothetical protein
MRNLSRVAIALMFLALRVRAEPMEVVRDVPADLPSIKRIDRVTEGPLHHFVGYYGITPWNASGTQVFCLESPFGDRLVEADDKASICLINPGNRTLTQIAQTSAWNLQQGAMVHWLPTADDRKIIYNDRIEGRLVSVVLDTKTNKRRVIDRPIAAIAPDGKSAIGINYDRLRQIRPVTGYAGGDPTIPLVKRPKDEGLFLVDLSTGESRLIISVAACCKQFPPPEELGDQPFWLEHALFSRDGGQVFVMARTYERSSRRLVSIPLTVRPDGTDLRALLPWAVQGASHYDWLDDRRLVVTREQSPGKWRHLLLSVDGSAEPHPLAPDVLTRDGHCSFSPDRRWMITDSYPDENRRQHLYILDIHTGHAARLASFISPPEYRGDWRCDLHPRWSRDSQQICIDSTHDGIRQVYVIHLQFP